jgi:hypothetical protein
MRERLARMERTLLLADADAATVHGPRATPPRDDAAEAYGGRALPVSELPPHVVGGTPQLKSAPHPNTAVAASTRSWWLPWRRGADAHGGASSSAAAAAAGAGSVQPKDDTSAAGDADADATGVAGAASAASAGASVLRGAALGEFALHVHSFLLLLDFSSLANPTAASDAIHHELQDLLRHGQLSVAQQTALLASVKERQAALAGSL